MKKLYLSLFTLTLLSLSGCGANATTQQTETTVAVSSEEVATEASANEANSPADDSTESHIYDHAVILPATNGSEQIGEYSYIEMPSDEVTMDALIDWYYNYVEKNDYLYNIILYSDKDDLSGVFGMPGHIETNVVFTSYEFGDSSCSYVNAYPNSKTYTRNDEGTFTEITFDD